MTEDRWKRVADIFDAAQAQRAEARPAFVRDAAAGDADLQQDVESLLAADDQPLWLDESLAASAGAVLTDNSGVLPGTLIGPYRIDNLLGVGGMGEVYRARDTKLNRDVAIKILPPAFASDPDRLARFKREAQVLASLNHPNIGGIYGFEDADRVHALVLELVEGPTLADRLAPGSGFRAHGLAIDEVLAIARQIADALEAAHELGIIHRDLKPANIKVRDDGTVKVLDFGLAKIAETTQGRGLKAEGGLTQSPTITTPAMTVAGMILGTAAYMSPEQAKGKPADKRADLWAFGVVLYEMLTGTRPFDGEDVADVLAQVLTKEPDLTLLPPETPTSVRRLLTRCLTKDRKRRLSDAGDARLDIEDAITSPTAHPRTSGVSVAPSSSRWARTIAVAALLLGTVVAAAALYRRVPQPLTPVVRFAVVLAAGKEFAPRSSILALSPDGSRLVYAGDSGQLYLRTMAEMDARPIPGTGLDVMAPFFSPDGQWIGFYSFRDSSLKKVSVNGGTPITLCKADPPYGVRWEGDRILFADQGTKGILSVPEDGGEPEVLIPVAAGEVFASPQMMGDGTSVLFTVANSSAPDRWDRAQIVVQTVGSMERRVVQSGSEGVYLPTGHLVFMQGGALRGVPFDHQTLKTAGAPVTLVDGIRRFTANVASPAASVAFTAAGAMAYVPGSVVAGATDFDIALVARDGTTQSLHLPPRTYSFPRLSPNGRQLTMQADIANESIIYVHDLGDRAIPRRLTFGGRNRFPVWSPDGQYITFQSDRDGDRGIFRQRADGRAPAERLTTSEPLTEHRPETWTPDGGTLLFTINPPTSVDFRLHMWSVNSAGRSEPFDANLPARYAALSPDGKWLAYASVELGTQEIFVRPFPRTEAKYQISSDGGRTPLWSPDGKQLYYYANLTQKFTAVPIQTTPTVAIGTPVALPIRGLFNTLAAARNYDVTPDGKQFAVVARDDRAAEAGGPVSLQVNVVLHWFEELKRLVPAQGGPR